MIISDRHHFVFAHIPKCAGTSVRDALQHLDDRDGFYTGRVDQHPTLGLLDYVHIPLFNLRDHFRSEFEKAGDYWSFAVVRDPFGRFPSAAVALILFFDVITTAIVIAAGLVAQKTILAIMRFGTHSRLRICLMEVTR
jgi:hypothetical protein